MNPAFSVIFLTTLIGVGQGLFIALMVAQVYDLANEELLLNNEFFVNGAIISLAFMGGGLVASFFHLGHPERAWRAVTRWRTSWLSREVIAIPVFIGLVTLYTGSKFFALDLNITLLIGFLAVISSIMLFYFTGMIYACLSFLREWATPLTVINFMLFGSASGFALASYYASLTYPQLSMMLAKFSLAFTVIVFATRSWTLFRNACLRKNLKTTPQTAIGIKHPKIQQKSQGQMGGSYNTREFFHGKSDIVLKNIKTIFLTLVFPVPIMLLAGSIYYETHIFILFAFISQYVGLIAERWFFFAQVNHPQNIYYQTIS